MGEEVSVTIVTIRDIFQDEAAMKSRFASEYRQLSALIDLDKQDMARLGAKEGQKLLVENELGKVIVAARQSTDEPHPGLAFMNNSPWSNHLVAESVGDSCIPGFKKIMARISVTEEDVTQISELVQRMKG
jgi:formylmethanofuran dehydrogenase subunit D